MQKFLNRKDCIVLIGSRGTKISPDTNNNQSIQKQDI